MNASVTWMNTTERRSLMRPSPPQNGSTVKETLIPEEMTTNIDVELGGSRKTMPSLSNASLRIGFVHQEDSDQTAAPVIVSSGLAPSPNSGGQQQMTGSPSGVLYHRSSKPTEWRIHLAHVKVRLIKYFLISLHFPLEGKLARLSGLP